MKKNKSIKIKISTEEYDQIKIKAEKLGLATSTYCRLILLAVKSPLSIS